MNFVFYLSGLADPQALNQAVAAYQACHFIGMPECDVSICRILLSQAWSFTFFLLLAHCTVRESLITSVYSLISPVLGGRIRGGGTPLQ